MIIAASPSELRMTMDLRCMPLHLYANSDFQEHDIIQ